MTIQDMHYDFKQKHNKIDSQKNRDLIVPEIDWKLNEAQELFLKMVAQPRLQKQYGFETNQRVIDDIRTVVIDQVFSNGVIPTVYDGTSYIATLPTNYWFYSKSTIYANKGTCENVKMKKVRIVQHDDEHEENIFNKSSFEWREVNVRFNTQGFRIFTDGTFQITKVCFEYLKRPRLIHNAADWRGGTYNLLDGTALTGRVDCELPEHVHTDIVDLAVAITAGDLSLPSYQSKMNKLGIDQLQ